MPRVAYTWHTRGSTSYQLISKHRVIILKILSRARMQIAAEQTSENLAGDTCACRDLNIVRVGVSKTRLPPSVSKVKLPSVAAAMKNHVLNVFESGWHGRRAGWRISIDGNTPCETHWNILG